MTYLNRSSLFVSLTLGMLLLPAGSQADIVYRWLDKENIVHYSERPPKGVKATRIKTSSGSSSALKKGDIATPESERPDKVKLTEAGIPKPNKNKEVCERASFNYNLLNERARIKQKDENGEARFLSDEEKAEQKKAAKDAMDLYC